MARVRLNVSDVDGLGKQNYLRKNELSEFKEAYDFLLRTRNELHFRNTRPTDLLSSPTEMQPKVAYRHPIPGLLPLISGGLGREIHENNQVSIRARREYRPHLQNSREPTIYHFPARGFSRSPQSGDDQSL